PRLQAAEGLGRHGSLHRPRLPALPPGEDEALPQGPEVRLDEVPHRAPPLPARGARPRPYPRERVHDPAAGEAEGPPDLRGAREAVPPALRRGDQAEGDHRREPPPYAGDAPRQRRLPGDVR